MGSGEFNSSKILPSMASNEEPLPPGWQMKFTVVSGVRKPYYVNHLEKKTSWEDPRKQAATTTIEEPLPPGWQKKFTVVSGERKPYYVNHVEKKTSWEDPRKLSSTTNLAYEPQPSPLPSPKPSPRPLSKPAENRGHNLFQNALQDYDPKSFGVSPASSRTIPITTVTEAAEESYIDSQFDFLAKSRNDAPVAPSRRQTKQTNLDDYFQDTTLRDTLESSEGSGSIRKYLAKGQNPDLRKGPNAQLLRSKEKLAKGPNPSLRKGPQKDLARGPRVVAA